MSGWWNDLSSRERLLVIIAGVLAGVLLLSLGIMRPLAEWRASAASNANAARSAYELTAAAAAVAGGRDESATPSGSLRDALVASTRAAGIVLVRIGSDADNRIEVQIEPVAADIFFAWLAELENRYGVTLSTADLARGQGGVVTPQVLAFQRI